MTHETQPCKRWELDSHITLKQLYNMLEDIDTYDALKKLACEEQIKEAEKERQKYKK